VCFLVGQQLADAAEPLVAVELQLQHAQPQLRRGVVVVGQLRANEALLGRGDALQLRGVLG
jgi:hypothetical protein